MDDAAVVGKIEALADLQEDRHHGPGVVDDSGPNQGVEIVAGEKLLNDVRDVVFDTEIEDQGDVAVDQVADELGLLVESLTHLLVGRGAHLHRHRTLDVRDPNP